MTDIAERRPARPSLLRRMLNAFVADLEAPAKEWQARYDRGEDPDPSEPGGPAYNAF